MISVVVTNFNGEGLLRRNLPKLLALLRKSRQEFEVILADDNSTDGSREFAEEVGLIISKTEKNEGFAGNIDRAFRRSKGEVIFSIKSDAVPKSADYFSFMLKHFGDPKVFAVSAALEMVEEGKRETRGRGEIYFEKGFFLHRGGGTDAGMSAWADGSASAFRKDMYLKLGGFDRLYNPFYWEDVDLGYRAWKAGYQIDYEPKAMLLHDYVSGAIAKHYDRKQVLTISQRNQFIFVWKNADLKHLLLYFLWETYHFTVAFKNRNGLFFRAYWQAFLKWPEIIAARWRQRKMTKLSDFQVLSVVH